MSLAPTVDKRQTYSSHCHCVTQPFSECMIVDQMPNPLPSTRGQLFNPLATSYSESPSYMSLLSPRPVGSQALLRLSFHPTEKLNASVALFGRPPRPCPASPATPKPHRLNFGIEWLKPFQPPVTPTKLAPFPRLPTAACNAKLATSMGHFFPSTSTR